MPCLEGICAEASRTPGARPSPRLRKSGQTVEFVTALLSLICTIKCQSVPAYLHARSALLTSQLADATRQSRGQPARPRPAGATIRGPLVREPDAPPIARPRGDAGEWPAGVRSLPSHAGRPPPRDRSLRPDPQRRSHPRDDPLRQQRAPIVRAAAIAP